MITRIVENRIKSDLFMGKTIIVYGARQIGKTTPVRKVVSDFGYAESKTAVQVKTVRYVIITPEDTLIS
ncbi:MAG: hypothetical protein HUU54_14285 [Ignavibacteriaceae bacterium]|nr:hypothetical protein [Ignavibacteriaceae bacterium]